MRTRVCVYVRILCAYVLTSTMFWTRWMRKDAFICCNRALSSSSRRGFMCSAKHRPALCLHNVDQIHSWTPSLLIPVRNSRAHPRLKGHSVVYLPSARTLLTCAHHSPPAFRHLLLHSRPYTSGRKTPPNTGNTVRYIVATTIVVLGLSYAAVPLYRLFCQASGYGGTVTKVEAGEKVERMEPIRERSIVVRFNADTSAGMRWHFKPEQKEITNLMYDSVGLLNPLQVVPGETALAFYTASNPTDKPVTGISTYNVVPFEAGQYFNKIQCFCFEEQILNPNEQVDMPVFFYIDPDFNEDPAMARVTSITLSYTFFEAKEGDSIYLTFPQSHQRH